MVIPGTTFILVILGTMMVTRFEVTDEVTKYSHYHHHVCGDPLDLLHKIPLRFTFRSSGAVTKYHRIVSDSIV